MKFRKEITQLLQSGYGAVQKMMQGGCKTLWIKKKKVRKNKNIMAWLETKILREAACCLAAQNFPTVWAAGGAARLHCASPALVTQTGLQALPRAACSLLLQAWALPVFTWPVDNF